METDTHRDLPYVLVTGGAGYIGSVLVRQLLEAGYGVRVLDNLRFGGESLLGLLDNPAFQFVKADVRDIGAVKEALRGCVAAAQLAAIVGDPACAREPALAQAVNHDATLAMYEAAESAGLERFVFASTCSNYGRMQDPSAYVHEGSELRPVSLYAETKVAVEQYLLSQPRTNRCVPTSLRFATVYGASPRMRFDLTVNEFTRARALGQELVVFGEQFWRPYCHVRDLARSVVSVLQAPREAIAFEVFNVGDTTENYQKKTLIDLILREVPEGRVRYVEKLEDPRDYRVDFSKIRDRLGFRISRTVPDGIREIKELLEQGFLVDPNDAKYANVPTAPVSPKVEASSN